MNTPGALHLVHVADLIVAVGPGVGRAAGASPPVSPAGDADGSPGVTPRHWTGSPSTAGEPAAR